MNNNSILAADNIAYLQQGIDLLERTDDALFTRTHAIYFGSGLGAHLRHCIDHYDAFLSGVPQGRIDYDARARTPRLETDRAFALERLREISARLAALPAPVEEQAVEVKMDSGEGEPQASGWTRSTAGRELQFLVSHTVHHYALMALILKILGQDPGDDFGVAPSTLRHQRSQLPCAR